MARDDDPDQASDRPQDRERNLAAASASVTARSTSLIPASRKRPPRSSASCSRSRTLYEETVFNPAPGCHRATCSSALWHPTSSTAACLGPVRPTGPPLPRDTDSTARPTKRRRVRRPRTYAPFSPETFGCTRHRAVAGSDAIWMDSSVEMTDQDDHTRADFTVRRGETVAFAITWQPSHLPAPPYPDPFQTLTDTTRF